VNIRESIIRRIEYLQTIITEKERALDNAPEGMVKGNRHGADWQYYYRKHSSDKNGVYIRKNDIALARALGQKEYDKKILKRAQQEIQALKHLIGIYEQESVEEIYGNLPLSYQPLVNPIEIPINVYVDEWKKTTFQRKVFNDNTHVFYTNKGEQVRSKSEVLIANILENKRIPYHYEKPLLLSGYGTVYPDFTLLDVRKRREVYWEHLGLWDESEYREKALDKISTYILNGYMPGEQLILTYETGKHPLNMKVLDIIINQFMNNHSL